MSEIKLELRERNEAIAMAYTKGYQQGRADVLMPYDVESVDELIVNVRNKAIDEFAESIRKHIGNNGVIPINIIAKQLKEQKNE